MDIDFQTSDNISASTTLRFQFHEPSVGSKTRFKRRHSENENWTPIRKILKTFQYKRNDSLKIDRSQFPVVPAKAITIHKSQGATYDNVVIHITPRMERPALYVACSSATKASGLFLKGNFKPPKPLDKSDKVYKEIQLQKSKKLFSHYNHMINKTDF